MEASFDKHYLRKLVIISTAAACASTTIALISIFVLRKYANDDNNFISFLLPLIYSVIWILAISISSKFITGHFLGLNKVSIKEMLCSVLCFVFGGAIVLVISFISVNAVDHYFANSGIPELFRASLRKTTPAYIIFGGLMSFGLPARPNLSMSGFTQPPQ